MSENSILIIDDEPDIITALKRVFLNELYTVYSARSATAGLEILKLHPVKVVISDELMPVMTGSEFLAEVRRQYPHTIRIILTGHANLEAAMRSINQGEIYRFITKPWNDLELVLLIRSAIEKYNLEEANRSLIIKNFNTLYELLRVADPKTNYVCQCTNCGQAIDMKYLYCPFCGAFRHDLCRVCNMPVEAAWVACPFCGTACGASTT